MHGRHWEGPAMKQEKSKKPREGSVKLKSVCKRLCQHWFQQPLCVSFDWPGAVLI